VLLISPLTRSSTSARHLNIPLATARRTLASESFDFLRDNVTPVVICESELPDGNWQDVLAKLGQCGVSVAGGTSRRATTACVRGANMGAYNVLAKPLNMKEVFHVSASPGCPGSAGGNVRSFSRAPPETRGAGSQPAAASQAASERFTHRAPHAAPA